MIHSHYGENEREKKKKTQANTHEFRFIQVGCY